jgi:hypothetical protein
MYTLNLVSFIPQPLYTWGWGSQYPANKRQGGPQSQSGTFGEEKILATAGNKIVILELCFLGYYTASRVIPYQGFQTTYWSLQGLRIQK